MKCYVFGGLRYCSRNVVQFYFKEICCFETIVVNRKIWDINSRLKALVYQLEPLDALKMITSHWVQFLEFTHNFMSRVEDQSFIGMDHFKAQLAM